MYTQSGASITQCTIYMLLTYSVCPGSLLPSSVPSSASLQLLVVPPDSRPAAAAPSPAAVRHPQEGLLLTPLPPPWVQLGLYLGLRLEPEPGLVPAAQPTGFCQSQMPASKVEIICMSLYTGRGANGMMLCTVNDHKCRGDQVKATCVT